jgi:hypothetical protein
MSTKEKNQYLFIFRHSMSQPDPTPEEMQQIFGNWMAWLKAVKASGNYVGGDRLDDGGKVLRNPKGATVTDGPYIEAKEAVGGYIIVTAYSLDEAAEIAKGCPGLDNGGKVEVRQIEKLPPI